MLAAYPRLARSGRSIAGLLESRIPLTPDCSTGMLASGILPNDRSSLPSVWALVDRYRGIGRHDRVASQRERHGRARRCPDQLSPQSSRRTSIAKVIPSRGISLRCSPVSTTLRSASGSARLELARYLSSPDNPQTARVYVNRVWQWVFGTGIVATPNDFRKTWRPSISSGIARLAGDSVHEGMARSTKKLVRRLVLSQTFRQGKSS